MDKGDAANLVARITSELNLLGRSAEDVALNLFDRCSYGYRSHDCNPVCEYVLSAMDPQVDRCFVTEQQQLGFMQDGFVVVMPLPAACVQFYDLFAEGHFSYLRAGIRGKWTRLSIRVDRKATILLARRYASSTNTASG